MRGRLICNLIWFVYLSDPFMKILVSMFHIGLCWMQCKALWVFAWLSLSLGLDLLSTPKSLGLVLVLKHSSLGQDLVSVDVVLTTVLVCGAKKCDSGQRNLFAFDIIWQNVFFTCTLPITVVLIQKEVCHSSVSLCYNGVVYRTFDRAIFERVVRECLGRHTRPSNRALLMWRI